MINDNIKPTGQLHIILRDVYGNIKEERHVKNLIVTVGKNVIAARLQGNSMAVMSHMGLGTDTVAPVLGNTELGAEIVGSRTALSVAGGTVVTNTVTYSTTFGGGVGTGAVTEAAIFNAASAGNMLCRTAFAQVNKDVSDTMTISWVVNII